MAENIKITNNKYARRVWPTAGNQLIVATVTIIKRSLFFKEEKYTNLHEHLFQKYANRLKIGVSILPKVLYHLP